MSKEKAPDAGAFGALNKAVVSSGLFGVATRSGNIDLARAATAALGEFICRASLRRIIGR
jgi:hypothetical protein